MRSDTEDGLTTIVTSNRKLPSLPKTMLTVLILFLQMLYLIFAEYDHPNAMNILVILIQNYLGLSIQSNLS